MSIHKTERTVGQENEQKNQEFKGRAEKRKATQRHSEYESQEQSPLGRPGSRHCSKAVEVSGKEVAMVPLTGAEGIRQGSRSRGRRVISFKKSAVEQGRECRDPTLEAVVISG